MRKFLFLSLAAAATLSSCNSGDSVAPDFEAELQPIQLGISNATLETETRGTGTVGGADTTSNKWKGQSFNVYMLCKDVAGKDSMAIAKFSGDEIYNNAPFVAPNGSAMNIATPVDARTKYYPSTRNFNFYAYRLDDAGTDAPSFDANNDSLSVPFSIDGSQDIMVAKAYLLTDGKIVPNQANLLKIGSTTAQKNANAERYYSAFSARHGVQPIFKFKHLLTRLKFQILPCNASATDPANGLVIDQIKVVSTKKSGVLTIAGKDDNTTGTLRQKITWGASGLFDYILQQRQAADADNNMNLETLASLDLQGAPYYSTTAVADGRQTDDKTAATQNIGEALLLAPEASYELHVIGHVNLKNKGVQTFDFKDTIKLSKGSFVAGSAYTVIVSVYGYEEMKISATLNAWNWAGTINLQPQETYVDDFATE
jgi:hypothetical protein